MLLRMFIVIGLLVATGCGHAPVSTSGASAKNVACYFGESRMVLPDGRRVSKYQTLLRRVLMPEKSLVGEAVVAMIPDRPKGIHRIGTVVEPDGTFRFKETQSGATGTGKFEGEPWRWHGWTSTAQLASKVLVKTRVSLKDGVLRSTKTVLGAKDKLKFTITDHLKEIGHTECERRFLRLKHEV